MCFYYIFSVWCVKLLLERNREWGQSLFSVVVLDENLSFFYKFLTIKAGVECIEILAVKSVCGKAEALAKITNSNNTPRTLDL